MHTFMLAMDIHRPVVSIYALNVHKRYEIPILMDWHVAKNQSIHAMRTLASMNMALAVSPRISLTFPPIRSICGYFT